MKKPRLKKSHRLIHIPPNTYCFGDIGPNTYSLSDPPAFFETLLSLLDGEHETHQIVDTLKQAFPDENPAFFGEAIQQMQRLGLLEEAAFDTTLSKDEQAYYHRQDLYFSLIENQSQPGAYYQENLKTKTIAILGAGGYGCWLALTLSLLGFKKIKIVDGDTIELSNANRQVLYSPHDVGQPKAQTAVKKLKALNPFVEYEAINEYISEDSENLKTILDDVDCIFMAWTNLSYFSSSNLEPYIHSIAIEKQIPVFEANADPFDIMIGPLYLNDGKTPNFFELRDKIKQHWLKENAELSSLKIARAKEDEKENDTYSSPQYAAPLSILAGIVVSDITKCLAGIKSPTLIGKQFHLNLDTFESKLIDWSKVED